METEDQTSSESTTRSLAVKQTDSVTYHRATVNNYLHSMKSRQYDEPMIEQFAQRLNDIAYSMGFKKAVETQVVIELAKWICKQFGDVSMQEVALAFDLATANKLPMKPRHYDRFDKQYVGDVIHAFKSWRSSQLKLYKEEEAMKQLTEEVKSVGATGKEMYNALKKIAVEKGEIMIAADWNLAFKYAQNKGLIEHLSNDEKDIYKENVRADLHQESASESNRSSIMNVLRNERSLADECRKRMLTDHLKKLIEETEEQRSKDDKKPEK